MITEGEQYRNRVATVVGGHGRLGTRVVKLYEEQGFRQVRVCEQGDPFRDYLRDTDDTFFAVDASKIKDMLQASRDLLRPEQTLLDGASVKTDLITLYRELDSNLGISVCSTHLGSVPEHPWRGVKVWVCEVGPNSERAKRLAVNLFLSRNTSIREINIEDHPKVERDQWFTFASELVFGTALRNAGLPLEEFDSFATLNSELATLPLARSLGQDPAIISEILYTQPRREIFVEYLRNALLELQLNIDDPESLKQFIEKIAGFHDQPPGVLVRTFRKAGIVGARNANMRMYSLSLRITDDRPGRLRELLDPFYEEEINLASLDTMAGVITSEEEARGVDPEKIVDFDIGIDPKTINPEKETRIREKLIELGCAIVERRFT